MRSKTPQKIVVAYSGGLDTSVMLHWLKREHDAEIVAFCADVGQGRELEGLEAKARETGADEVYVEDLREEFARDYVFFAVKAQAVYEGVYLLGTSLARPPIAAKQVEIAKRCGADALAHGATGKGNDQVRFELTYQALAPEMTIIAPWRSWPFKGRSDLIAYAKEHGIPVTATAEKPYSTDRNLMHVSYEGGILEDPWAAPPEDIFQMTTSPRFAPDEPEEIVIDFEHGMPVAVDGTSMSPATLLAHLNERAGRHGIGRVDVVENRYVGIKSRGVYETPGAMLLHTAYRAVESLTLDREAMHLRDDLMPRIASAIYNGYWFSPEMALLRDLVESLAQSVTGTARLSLYKGRVAVNGRKSPHSLYNPELATFEGDQVYDQKDAGGFIRLSGLRLRAKPQGAMMQADRRSDETT